MIEGVKKGLGMLLLFSLCCVGMILPCVANEAGELPEDEIDRCSHTLTYMAATEPTFNTTGHTENWHCSKCGKTFSDAAAKHEISQMQTVIKPMDADHDGSVTPADAAAYLSRASCLDAAKVLQRAISA